jgi:hypothetical protein
VGFPQNPKQSSIESLQTLISWPAVHRLQNSAKSVQGINPLLTEFIRNGNTKVLNCPTQAAVPRHQFLSCQKQTISSSYDSKQYRFATKKTIGAKNLICFCLGQDAMFTLAEVFRRFAVTY